ncbi:hypothetical protein LG324_12870 [Phycicoccus jejuensis]|uniref:hypothetical protein n=1 Tax=Phycicoccus jejuensis TaxID=367299 RepID=UPI00384EFC89
MDLKYQHKDPVDHLGELGARVDAAAEATRALASAKRIGTLLDAPHLKKHVLLRMDGSLATEAIGGGFGKSGGYGQRIVLFGASHRLVDGRRALVVLIGSQHNLLTDGVRQRVQNGLGKTPSDMNGLYAIFEDARDPNSDRKPDAFRLKEDRKLSKSELIHEAASLYFMCAGDRLRPVVALADIHTFDTDVDLGDELGSYDVVAVGAALWIREVDRGPRAAEPIADLLGGPPLERFSAARLGVLENFTRAMDLKREELRLTQQLHDAKRMVADRDAASHRAEMFGELLANGLIKGTQDPDLPEGRWAGPTQDMERAATVASASIPRLEAAIAKCESLREDALSEAWAREALFRREVSTLDAWPDFARWFTLQAYHEGIPFVRLTVDRRNGWLTRLRQRARTVAELTSVEGVLLNLRAVRQSNGQGGKAEFALVTPTGDVYPVWVRENLGIPDEYGVGGVDVDLRPTEIVYDPEEPESATRGLAAGVHPEPDVGLISAAATEMAERASLWRRTASKRSDPVVNWRTVRWLGTTRNTADTEDAQFVPLPRELPSILDPAIIIEELGREQDSVTRPEGEPDAQ